MLSKAFLTEEAIFELNKFIEIEQKFNRDDLVYQKGDNKKDKIYDFQNFKTLRSFGREIYSDYLTIEDVLEEQIQFKNEIDNFKESLKPKTLDKKREKTLTFENKNRPLGGRQKLLTSFEYGIFSVKNKYKEKYIL